LLGNVPKSKNIHRQSHLQSRQAKHFPIPTNVQLHTDPLGRYTIIELITTDHPGLLSSIGKVFVKQQIYLHNAKISTIGSRVEDMFYVTGCDDLPIKNEQKLEALKKAIFKQLAIL
jgi:[protein-PII] uridylyltransferase